MSDRGSEPVQIPDVAVRTKSGVSIVWLIPAVAVIIAGWLAYTTLSEKGPEITISFKTAAGLEADKTKIKFKDVQVGLVDFVKISEDLSAVIVTASLDKEVEPHLTDGTRFWVVRPRLGAGGVSGLDTLVSGAYIELDAGTGEPRREFVGLEVPPVIRSDDPGREFVLLATKRGSVGAGSPIYFRGIDVGEVMGYRLTDDNQGLRISIFIRAPHDALVRENSRFWNTSGINVTVDADGVKVSTESIQALLSGGVAFETPFSARATEPVNDGTEFRLFDDFESITELSYTEKIAIMMHFDGSVRGLQVGAPVEFRGIKIGSVTDFHAVFDAETLSVRIPVTVEIEPERIFRVGERGADPYKGLEKLVALGLRAQLQSGNLLTGQLLVAWEFHSDAQEARVKYDGPYPEMPTVPSTVDQLTGSVSAILTQIANLPLHELIQDLQTTLKSANRLLESPDITRAIASLEKSLARMDNLMGTLESQAGPLLSSLTGSSDSADITLKQANSTLITVQDLIARDSKIVFGTNELLEELTDAARSIRILTDYLESHPEALLRGKSGAAGQ